jgi:hypothetical protein
MKSVNPMLYVVVIIAFAGLIYTIYLYNKVLEGFNTASEGFDVAKLAEKFQALPDDQKDIVCKTLTDQIAQVKGQATSEADSQKVVDEITKQMKTIGC